MMKKLVSSVLLFFLLFVLFSPVPVRAAAATAAANLSVTGVSGAGIRPAMQNELPPPPPPDILDWTVQAYTDADALLVPRNVPCLVGTGPCNIQLLTASLHAHYPDWERCGTWKYEQATCSLCGGTRLSTTAFTAHAAYHEDEHRLA